MNRILSAFAATLIAASLAARSSGSGDEPAAVEPTKTASEKPASEGLPDDIAEELGNKIDVEPGQAVVPGSVPWQQVDGLSEGCEAAIQPVRDLMVKYKSALLITDATDAAVLGDTNRAAQENCTPREYATWYGDEFNGWLNAATTSE
jgi:rare lipoprotein A (peptidoglycan hydrolase)